MVIPVKERYIGTPYDNNSDVRQIQVDRITVNGVDLSNLNFFLDQRFENGAVNTLELTKEVQDEYIMLTWNITESQLQVVGTVFVNIRANDGRGLVKWASNKGAFYVEDVVNAPQHFQGNLTLLEQYEAKVNNGLDRANRISQNALDTATQKGNEAIRLATEARDSVPAQLNQAKDELRSHVRDLVGGVKSEIDEKLNNSLEENNRRIQGAIEGVQARGTQLYSELTNSVNNSISEIKSSNVREVETLKSDVNARVNNSISSLESKRSEIDRTIYDVQKRISAGEFKGEKGDRGEVGPQGIQGPRGERGTDAVIHTLTTGQFAFHINEESHLILNYADGDTPPKFKINEQGHLVYEIN